MSHGYDNQYRVSSIVTGSIVNLTYGYDPNGNIISILDGVNPPGSEPIDNPGTYTYQQGTNKLTHIEGTPPADFGYDLNGNITTENTCTYMYDLSNQLIRVLDGVNQIAEYTYNGAGQRIKKVTQTEARIFHYDILGHLIAETDQNGQMLAEYVYLGDQLLAMIKPGESAYYFHNDHLGTPQVLTDDTQTISWKADYTPFGEAVISVETVENPFRFPGQYYDQETGLHYNYFRYYNPQAGRYITPDPIGLEGGINLFLYVEANPVNWMDPEGLNGTAVPLPIPKPRPIWRTLPKWLIFPISLPVGIAIAIGSVIVLWPSDIATDESIAEDEPCSKNQERCYEREQAEIGYCYTRPRKWWGGCINRAQTRRDLCLRGLPEPPLWGPADEEVGWNPGR